MQSPRNRSLRPLRHWGGAAVDNDVAVDAQAEGTGAKAVADSAAASASSENASGVASKNELSAPASNDDQPNDKASASTEAASKDATPASETKDGNFNDQVNAASNEAVTAAEYTVGIGESITIFGSGSLWESSWASEGSAATVAGNGNKATVTGVSAGDATVTYTYKSVFLETKTQTFVIHVVDARPKISIEGDLVVGGKIKLSVQNFENADAIQWASDNTKVATIDSDGVVEGISVGKANITASAASESATKQIEVKRNESNGGYYVYLYTKAEGDTTGLALTKNKDGWYTIGRVWVNGITNPAEGSTNYATSGDNYDKVINALKDPSKVDLYGVNSIDLEDIEWSVAGKSTGLKVASGASDYDTSNNLTWHLDGYVNFDTVDFGSVVFHYVDALNHSITIAEDKKVTAKATEPGKTFDFSKYIIPIKGYTYYTAKPLSVTIDKRTIKDVTLYYSKLPKRQIVMQAKSGTATYSGQKQSVSGFDSDVFEFDGVKYTVSGLAATAKGTDAGTYEGTVEGTAVVTDPEGNDVTAQFDVTANGGELVITPAALTVTTPDATRVYNGQPLTAAGTIEGFVNNETAGFTTTGSQTAVGESVNTYAIDWEAADATAERSNYTITENLGKLTVTEFADEVVATAGSYRGVYDGNPHGVDVTVTGLPEGYTVETASSNATATDVTDEAGVTANVDNLVIVNAQGEDVTGKLKVTKNTGAITITPAALTVTTPDATRVYNGQPLTAAGTIEGFVNNETAGFTTTGSQTAVGESVNTYAIEWTGTAKESNYKLESESIGILTVTAAPDSPTPDDQSKDQGVFNGNGAGLVQTGDVTGIYGIAAIIAAAVAAFVSLLAVRRRKE